MTKDILLTFYGECFDEYKKERDSEPYQIPPPKNLLIDRKKYLEKCLDNIKNKFVFASNYEYTLLYDILTEPILKEIRQIKYKLGEVSYTKIEEIKSIPIRQILDNYNIKVYSEYGNRFRFSIRDERIASCTAYVDQNSWWDYGSSSGGSVIDLVMSIEHCSVSEAIKKLNKN